MDKIQSKSSSTTCENFYTSLVTEKRVGMNNRNLENMFLYVEVSQNAYMKLDEIKKSNHPILDSSDVFCVQGD